MRKIFTKNMGGYVGTTGGGEIKPSADSWVVQEDIDIIGVDIIAECIFGITVNGFVHTNVEVSQAGSQTKDGAILRCKTGALQWNAIGQGGGGLGMCVDQKIVMFPEGYAISVKEEGHVNVHLQIETPVGEVADLYAWVQIYYVKKGK